MAGNDLLKYGFKAKCEKWAVSYRSQLSLLPYEPLSAFDLAHHLNILIYPATEFVKNIQELNLLAGCVEDSGWSALTMITRAGNRIIIHNPYHSSARQQSNIMHELAHVICEHKHPVNEYDFEVPLGMRQFDEGQEEEAKCLGATLQITRQGLLWGLKKNLNIAEIAKHFMASVDMTNYRMNTSGVTKQYAAIKRKTFASKIAI